MKVKYLTLIATLVTLFSTAAMAHDQKIWLMNLLRNSQDSFPARTQTTFLVDVYEGTRLCYSSGEIRYNDNPYLFLGVAGTNCNYISQLKIKLLPNQSNQVYLADSAQGAEDTLIVNIPGGATPHGMITVKQKSAPLFNMDGTIFKPGVAVTDMAFAATAR